MAVPSPLGDVKIVSPISTFVLNTFDTQIKCPFVFVLFCFFLLALFCNEILHHFKSINRVVRVSFHTDFTLSTAFIHNRLTDVSNKHVF